MSMSRRVVLSDFFVIACAAGAGALLKGVSIKTDPTTGQECKGNDCIVVNPDDRDIGAGIGAGVAVVAMAIRDFKRR
jgi:hypothetical protein